MKKIKLVTFLLITVVAFITTSCESINKVEMQERIKADQKLLVEKVISAYNIILTQSYIDQDQHELLNILFEQTDTLTVGGQDEAFYEFIDKRTEDYRMLGKVLEQFALVNKDKTDKTSNEAKALLIKYFEEIENKEYNSTDIDSVLQIIQPELKKVKTIKSYENFRKAMCSCFNFYYELWSADSSILQNNISRTFMDYEQKIMNLPDYIFKPEMLREILNQPYSDGTILVELYKRELKNKLYEDKLKLDKHLETLDSTFNLLVDVNFKYSEDSFFNPEIVESLDKIELNLTEI